MLVLRLVMRISVLAALLAVSAGVVSAQPYPSKPIRLVVPFAPGGGSDTVGRVLAQGLSEVLRVSVVVENKPGAAGVVGTESVARASEDGYTLLLADSSHVFNHLVLTKVSYDPLVDFDPIAVVARTPLVLAVPVKSSAQTAQEFIAMAKSEPGRLAIGSGGNGSIAHLTQEIFMRQTAVQLIHVPYKGSGPAINDVVAEQIQAILTPAPGVVSQVQGGKLRALAVTSATRNAQLPDVPAMRETLPELAGYEVNTWFGIFGPAGLPPAVTATLNAEIGGFLDLPATQARFAELGGVPVKLAPTDFTRFVRAEIEKWRGVIRTEGLQLDAN